MVPSRHPAYFGFSVSTLALAVGMNLIVFTVVNALWLRPLPFPNAESLVTLPLAGFTNLTASSLLVPFRGAVAGQVITDELSGLSAQVAFDQSGRDLETAGVSPGFFRLLGLSVFGRDFTDADDRAGAEPVAIISDRLWSRAFQRRTDLIGTVVPARPFPIRIIGVAPAGFQGARRGEHLDVWIPAALVQRVVRFKVAWSSLPMMVFARLPAGRTLADINRHLSETIRTDREGRIWLPFVRLTDVYGTPESKSIVIRETNTLAIVGGVGLLVLLGGCATLAALVLVHLERRRQELAVRVALGATRMQLVGQMCRELAWVAASGTALAVLLAVTGLHVIPSFTLPGGVALGRLDLSIDWRVLAAAVAAVAVTITLAAWLPISRVTRGAPVSDLLTGAVTTATAGSQRTRQGLLALQVCATIVVLVTAGLFVRAVVRGFGAGPGFDVGRTVFVKALVMSGFAEPPPDFMEQLAERTNRVREALRALSGVDSVADGYAPIDPDRPSNWRTPVTIESDGLQRRLVLGPLVGSPNQLSTLGVPVLEGRGLRAADKTAVPMPTILTASLARRLGGGQHLLGQVVRTGRTRGPLLIVGIARDFVYGSLTGPAAGVVVTAQPHSFGIEPEFVVRTAHPEAVAGLIRKQVKDELPDIVWLKASTGREIIQRDLGRQRLGAWFFSGFGLAALMLGVGGAFGLVAYLAESRRREFGVRLALGATGGDLVRRGLTAALAPVAIGLTAGLVSSTLVSRVFVSLLTGLSGLDPATYLLVGLTMLAATATAALGAAWRLQHMQPTDALRTN